MHLSDRIKPISYLKANAAQVLDTLRKTGEPMIITQNGEAKAVIQDIRQYEETEETLALLKILAHGEKQAAEGKVVSVEEAFRQARAVLDEDE
ncbi:MAG: type II toxin-antitoxin system Phd/YefM family antitoxin [Alphaproteobacteria bacterium]